MSDYLGLRPPSLFSPSRQSLDSHAFMKALNQSVDVIAGQDRHWPTILSGPGKTKATKKLCDLIGMHV